MIISWPRCAVVAQSLQRRLEQGGGIPLLTSLSLSPSVLYSPFRSKMQVYRGCVRAGRPCVCACAKKREKGTKKWQAKCVCGREEIKKAAGRLRIWRAQLLLLLLANVHARAIKGHERGKMRRRRRSRPPIWQSGGGGPGADGDTTICRQSPPAHAHASALKHPPPPLVKIQGPPSPQPPPPSRATATGVVFLAATYAKK